MVSNPQPSMLRNRHRKLTNGPSRTPLHCQQGERCGDCLTTLSVPGKSTGKTLIELATWNERSMYRPGCTPIVAGEARRYRIDVLALQEVREPGSGESTMASESAILCSGGIDGRHESGVAVMMPRRTRDAVIDVE